MEDPFNNKIKTTIIIFAVLLLKFNSILAQEYTIYQDSINININDTLKSRWGAYFNYGLNLFNADFKHLPGTFSCCTNYGSAVSPGFSAGAVFDFPFTDKFRVNLRGGFNQLNITHIANQPTNIILDNVSKGGNIEHKLEAKMAMIDFDIMPAYQIWDNFYVTAGVKLGYIIHSKFMQIERITDPAGPNAVFEETGLNYRNYYRGDIQDINKFLLFANAGIYYDISLNKKNSWYLTPEVYYSLGLIKFVKDLDWSAQLLRGGIAIKYQAPPPPPPPPPAPAAPPMPELPEPIAPPTLVASVSVAQLDSAGNKSDNIELKIEDFISLNMRPLLNYIFFDNNSFELPDRYNLINKAESEKFSESDLKNMDVIPTYYYVLNILGKRLKENPSAYITLTGTNSDEGDEKGNKELSMKRAERVRDYFVNTWGIDNSRFTLKAVNLPSEPSNANEPGGNEENKRVEITSDDPNLTEPVLTMDTLRKIPFSKIVFSPNASSAAGIKKWELAVLQNGQKIKVFNGEGELPKNLEWVIEEKSKNNPVKGGDVSYFLEVSDKLGQSVETKLQKIKVDQLTIDKKRVEGIADKEFEFYSLILFDYGKSKLGVEHKKTADFVKKRITDKSNVTIVGYTDSMGKEEINKKISTARANEFAKRINIKNAKIYGAGEEELLYDNNLPEGRFYCRTVKVNIETPIENNK